MEKKRPLCSSQQAVTHSLQDITETGECSPFTIILVQTVAAQARLRRWHSGG